eukprot:CAMPEP_0198312482 /NCGR_PEP_ID=MMETSP1450-20131203/3831_1 /TAXON_ID=753684 ORGANISM="Madagascaria erythrocladiodes, Strain CCMP3234" /NCGR_SAMPLE_ID=MMETSP1450 /ASSEMBLY_ACC=CAM_ASM_001115 /LENGTH=191 /DNA_ID=CAMNT_0044015427 /DNA_START=38 /DNA_END=613 /DNA_ORIENTATION=-
MSARVTTATATAASPLLARLPGGGGNSRADDELYEEMGCTEFCALSYRTRLIGFSVTLLVGVALVAVAILFLPVVALHPQRFAMLFTLGNLLGLLSTGFLVGPCRQLRWMAKPHRAVCAGVYVASVVATLVVAMLNVIPPLIKLIAVIVLVVVEFLALIYYGLSYIPGARKLVRTLVKTYCCSFGDDESAV